ncbi:electron transfer flavoprotein subunit beta/FixA family protein [Clostridiaceae bacterium 68-1-5]|uniref:Electron transfer flavoprotein small subunit n=1 Tax=Suipraeoptans intestinalis TaxID=2606628 RepID=A0A6N7URX5_9FIRM|nr:electron transfer flavoprotein subunit beta/FixA family protein [Suipraeoptans intestinalis]MSR93533.1 electron transfer flavoprotein subunit beta/FixA family protein [Suipraeoptans intestinalis]
MNIAVLIKQVPVSNNVSVDPETHALVRTSMEGMLNPADLNAIEAAMLLKEQVGGKVVAFTMGPTEAEKSLRDAMALGCEEGVLISDRCFGGADTLATAKPLARAIGKYGTFELILGGAMSSDGATGQVGAMVAEYLGIPHISEVSGIEYDGQEGIRGIKQCQGEEVTLEAQLPALMTVCFGCNEPRLATLRTKRKAKEKPLKLYTNEDLGFAQEEIGLKGSPTLVADSFVPERTRKAVMLKGTPEEMAAKIREWIEIEKGKN